MLTIQWDPDAIPYPLTVLVGTLGRKKPDIGDGALDAPGDDDEDVLPLSVETAPDDIISGDA